MATQVQQSMPGYVPAAYRSWVSSAAQGTGLPVAVVAAQIKLESGFNPHAVSSAGAEGLAQFLPSTFASYGSGSPFNPRDALGAYRKYMSALLKWSGGDVRKALAAYNAGQANWQAGLGYANSVLRSSGSSAGLRSSGGSGGGASGGGGGGGATPAQLDAFLTSSSPSGGVLADAGALLHGTAVLLDRIFGLFAPGQGWRIVFGATAVLLFIGSYRAFGGSVML